jgi:shikimate dehydrogenase
MMRFAVIGSPVAHSQSPAMHAAAYRALGLPHVYERLETSQAELPERVAALRDGTYAGLNVTIPHKKRILSLVDEVDPTASRVGAANTLVSKAGALRAHNTDAPALAAELAALSGEASRLVGRTGLVIGTGGAARAAVAALGSLGFRRVVVLGRDRSFAAAAEAILGSDASLATTSVVFRELGTGAAWAPPEDVAAIVQATSCGMTGAAPGEVVADAVAWDAVASDAVAIDVVYAPRDTPFLARARARGLATADGLGMLARQGALAFELWLGQPAPLDVMRAALLA